MTANALKLQETRVIKLEERFLKKTINNFKKLFIPLSGRTISVDIYIGYFILQI